MREVERSAASVEEAVEAALAELGVDEQRAEIEVVQQPRAGFLGLKSQEAVVRVRVREAPGFDTELLEEQADAGADFVEGLLEAMGVPADVEPNYEDGVMYVDVWAVDEDAEAVGVLIGRHGATLDALQEVTRGAVQRQTGQKCLVIVDVEDYRKRRRASLVSRARGVAARVGRTGKGERLEPMNPYERKIVHDAVAGVAGVTSESEGEEPERRVVIRPSRG